MSPQADLTDHSSMARLRPMARADLAAVATIELLSSPAPWSREMFGGCLRPDYLCHVLERGGEVVGFSIANFAANEGHLLNIAVDPGFRRLGYASLLLKSLLARYERFSVKSVFLEVRVSNEAAMRLYRRFGFQAIGVRRDYYVCEGGREDAVTMRREAAG
jgi:ribosomal-protein-alanine N-acetyltransferase